MAKCRHFKLVFSQLNSFILDNSLACTVSTLEKINNFRQLQQQIFDFERIDTKLIANRVNVFDAAAHMFFASLSLTDFSKFKLNP